MNKINRKKIVYSLGFPVIFIVLAFLVGKFLWPVPETILYPTFLQRITSHTVKDVELTTDSNEVRGTDTDGRLFYVVGSPENPYSNLDFLKILKDHNVRVLLDYREIK